MILSEDRMTHFAHVIIDGIWKDDLVDFSDDEQAMRAAKQAIVKFVNELGDIDDKARAKIHSLKRTVFEGSPEWDTLYRQYSEEEMRRRGNS